MTMAKRFISTILLSISLLFVSGWTSCPVQKKGAASTAEERGRDRIELINKSKATNSVAKMEAIAVFAYGVDYTLRLDAEPSKEVVTALDLNSRIMSLSGTPALDKMKEMKETIDQLHSDVAKVRVEGQKKLEAKDLEITALQNKAKQLEDIKDAEVAKYMKSARDAAAVADTNKAALDEMKDEMNAWGGLGAIFYGFKKLIIRLAWILGISTVLFIVLRVAAASNPIAASAFSIFSIVGSWMINGLKLLFGGKSVELAGHVPTTMFNEYKGVVVKIIDCIQLVKDRSKKVGGEPTLKEVMDEVSKSMDLREKTLVEEIKRDLNWK